MIEVWGGYYEEPQEGYRSRRDRGQLFEAFIPYSGEETVRRLKVVAAEEGSDPWCSIEEATLNDVRHAPAVPELDLREREAMIVRQAKCRRVILLSAPAANWQSGPTRSEGVYLVAPIYSFKSRDDEEHRSRVKAYAYNTLFWLPGDEHYGMQEGCARLDRVQPVHSALLDAKPVRLAAQALDGLTAWYGSYLMNKVPSRIGKYRDEALTQLQNRAAR